MTEMEAKEDAPLTRLVDILQNPEKNIFPLIDNSSHPDDQQKKKDAQAQLVSIAGYLFKEIERTAEKYHHLSEAAKRNDNYIAPPLSGLPELYMPEAEKDAPLDAETIWGQVELQNAALRKLAKKSTKRLAKGPEKIVLINTNLLSSDDEASSSENGDSDQESAPGQDASESEDEEGGDDEARRIRERMERAMQDMEDSDGELSDQDEPDGIVDKKETKPEKEDLYDPVAEDMKDGFFDLNEMEDFADEEEDYLPDEAYPETEADKNRKRGGNDKSFHQKQRDGDMLNPSDDDDDENDFEELYEEDRGPVRRKKYRDDEDIEALYDLYQTPGNEDSDEEDAINMTAADFFGQPSRKHMQRYNTKKAKEEVKDDDDSWGEYNFEDEGEKGWPSATKSSGEHEEMDDDDAQAEPSDSEEEEETQEAEDTTKHGKEQAKLKKQTAQLEKEMLSEKPWQMTGETKGTSRPVNSLLEGTPEFQMASKQAPTITVEHTASLEEVIKQRILQEDWDDVVPRELPDVAWHKKRGELPEVSQEKSKLGLGELYEREYLKKAVGFDKDMEEKKTEEDKAKDEMKQLFANLCSKLDALSNYHFAPRPIAEEAEVRAVTAPAIAMEEVLPLHVSDARGVAPEEVYATKRGREGVLRGENEMDQQERKRLRQSKKAARRKARKDKLADEKLISRLEPGLGLNNPYEKRKMREELSMARSRGRVTTGEKDSDFKYGSSGTFFKKLQAEAQMSIQGDSGTGPEKQEKKANPRSSAFKL